MQKEIAIDKVDERLLVRIWARQLISAESLVTGSGEKVQIIYPGKENRDSGPDFLGAVIATEGSELLVGDIELHLKASDWRNHGHHRDPGYNRVILQVVWEGEASMVLQNGKAVPTLSLHHCLKGSLEEVRCWSRVDMAPAEPCHNAHSLLGDDEMGQLLDEAGNKRFKLKASRFAAAMGEEPASQVLYQGIMGALGYTRNKEQFEELACRLPLAFLKSVCRDKGYQERVTLLRVLLLCSAGFLPDDCGEELGQVRSSLRDREYACFPRWHLFRVRPENHPARRLTGAAHLLARFTDEGLLEGVLRLVGESCSDIGRLEFGFMVGSEGYRSPGQRALIGQGRAREIVVNIALPFAFAWAEVNSEASLAEAALWLYRIYPKSGENEITRGLTRLLGSKSSPLVDSARRQQGLLHLDKIYCRPRRCDMCPVNEELSSAKGVGAIHELPLHWASWSACSNHAVLKRPCHSPSSCAAAAI